MSGRHLAEVLKEGGRDLKVLYMPGYTDDIVVRRSLLERGAAYIQKPFTPDALAQRVREVLDST